MVIYISLVEFLYQLCVNIVFCKIFCKNMMVLVVSKMTDQCTVCTETRDNL